MVTRSWCIHAACWSGLLAAGLLTGAGGCTKRVVKKGGLANLQAAARSGSASSPSTRRRQQPPQLGASAQSAATASADAGGSASQAGATWAFALERFQGSRHRERAANAKRTLGRRTNLGDLWVHSTADESIVYYGKFEGPTTEAAKRARRRVERLERSQAVSRDVLLAPVRPTSGEIGPYDLRQASSRGKYSLQIGFYTGDGRKQAAEKKAKKLRKQGTPAFYYHGAKRSMVTVGVFGEQAIVRSNKGTKYSSRVRAVQQRFPWNRANGEVAVAELENGKKVKQSSFLVRIPDSAGR